MNRISSIEPLDLVTTLQDGAKQFREEDFSDGETLVMSSARAVSPLANMVFALFLANDEKPASERTIEEVIMDPRFQAISYALCTLECFCVLRASGTTTTRSVQ